MYRCPVCDSYGFTFSTELRERVENRVANQSTSIFSVSIECCKCGEVLAQNDFVVTTEFGQSVNNEEVFELSQKYLEDWKRENNEQTLRELNTFNNCPQCKTSTYISLEKRAHFYQNKLSEPIYRIVCHGCNRETEFGLTEQSAIDKWNKAFPMEE